MREEALHRKDSLEQVDRQRILREESIENTEIEQDTLSVVATDSIKHVEAESKYGAFADGAEGEQKFITIENSKIKAVISTMGGKVYSVQMKGYKRFDSTDVVLFDGDKNIFGFMFFAQNRRIHTNELYFEPLTRYNNIDATDSEQTFAMRLNAGDNKYS